MINLAAHAVVFVACHFDRDQGNTLIVLKKHGSNKDSSCNTCFGSLVALHKTVSCTATYLLHHQRSPGSQIQQQLSLSGLKEGNKFFLGS